MQRYVYVYNVICSFFLSLLLRQSCTVCFWGCFPVFGDHFWSSYWFSNKQHYLSFLVFCGMWQLFCYFFHQILFSLHPTTSHTVSWKLLGRENICWNPCFLNGTFYLWPPSSPGRKLHRLRHSGCNNSRLLQWRVQLNNRVGRYRVITEDTRAGSLWWYYVVSARANETPAGS